MITVYVQVLSTYDRYPVEYLSGQLASWDGNTHMPISKADRLKGLNEQGPAEVRVSLEEKQSGPQGTFSSTSVRIEVSVRCLQDERTVEAAHTALYDIGHKALEQYLKRQMTVLYEHAEGRG